jgi:hypothetical protein
LKIHEAQPTARDRCAAQQRRAIDPVDGAAARIDYHHVIFSLVRKPGAFTRYRWREELFPSATFRRAYDALLSRRRERADRWDLIDGLTFDSRDVPQIQAADLIAYEFRKELDRMHYLNGRP